MATIDFQADSAHAAAAIGTRLEHLPSSWAVWQSALLLSLGAWFEIYDLFFTAYAGPGLVRSGLYTTTTPGPFDANGLAAFVAATFAGLFLGSWGLGWLADRYGRKAIFNAALLGYSAATAIMALQHDAVAINGWRLLAGIGLGVELVTIDSYLSELMPARLRGRAFAFNHVVQLSAVPGVALLAWWLVPQSPLGLDGWRWIALFGAVGAIGVWLLRRRLPESPLWLARQGRIAEAEQIVERLERRAGRDPATTPAAMLPSIPAAASGEPPRLWRPPYRRRAIMLMVFHVFQTIGYYGYAAWVPSLLIAQGVTVTRSLLYGFVIALANPLGPLLGLAIADRLERKWLIVASALLVALAGALFAAQTQTLPLIVCGVLVTIGSNSMSLAYHAYQTELFPTTMRARAVGLVYSLSRLSGMLSGFMIAFCLRHAGNPGVFALIGFSMLMVVASIGLFGPRSRGRVLDSI